MEKSIVSQDYALLLLYLGNARRARGLSQRDVAERIGETQSTVSKIERGERRLDVIELRVFCEALEISFLDFVRSLDAAIRERGAATLHGTDKTISD